MRNVSGRGFLRSGQSRAQPVALNAADKPENRKAMDKTASETPIVLEPGSVPSAALKYRQTSAR